MAFKITGSHTTPLMYKPVFDVWFFDERYQHWKNNKEATWQLRCIGGPGSGKTQFSSLVVQDLQNEYKGKNVAIVSIFFNAVKNCSEKPDAAVTTIFLTEVEYQLGKILQDSPQEDMAPYRNPIDAELTKLRINSEGDAKTRQGIATKRSSFERAFIIVDDLDIIRQHPKEYRQLEEEFVNLQKSDFKIFTTSRVPFKLDLILGFCDVHDSEDKLRDGSDHGVPVNIWWQCPTCIDGGEDEYYICDDCFKEGYRCQNAEHKDIALVQKRDRVNFDIGTPPLGDFVKYHLELTHGDLGLQSQVKLHDKDRRTLPPLTPLGRALKAPGNQVGMDERIKRLIDETGNNITIALLHLEHISLGERADVVGAQSDRLPRNIVASFDAGIDHIMNYKDDFRRNLGMSAIQFVGKRGVTGVSFAEVQEGIIEEWSSGEKSRIEAFFESEDSMEELLSAANGFLSLRFKGEEPYIECFHMDLDLYVNEDYGNSLVTFKLPVADEATISC